MATLNFNTTVTDWTTNSGSATAVPNSIPKTQFQAMLTELVPTTNFLDRPIVVNESGTSTYDFRVESDNQTHALFVDSSTDTVLINTDGTAVTYPSGLSTSDFELVSKGNTYITGDNTGSSTELWVHDPSGLSTVKVWGTTGSQTRVQTDAGNASLDLITMDTGGNVATTTDNYMQLRNTGTVSEFRILDSGSVHGSSTYARTPLVIDNATGNVGIGGAAQTGWELTVYGNQYITNSTGGAELYVTSSTDNATVWARTTSTGASHYGQLTAEGPSGARLDLTESGSSTNDRFTLITASAKTRGQIYNASNNLVHSSYEIDHATGNVGIAGAADTGGWDFKVNGNAYINGTGETTSTELYILDTGASATASCTLEGTGTNSKSSLHLKANGGDSEIFLTDTSVTGSGFYTTSGQGSAGDANSFNLRTADSIFQIRQYDHDTTGHGSYGIPFQISKTEVLVNNSGLDLDFRVESDGNTNMLVVDGGNNAVGIGGAASTTGYELKVTGQVEITDALKTGQHNLFDTRVGINCNPDTVATGYALVVGGSAFISSSGGQSGTELFIHDTTAKSKMVMYGATGCNLVMQDATTGTNTTQAYRFKNRQGDLYIEQTDNTQSTTTAVFGRWLKPRHTGTIATGGTGLGVLATSQLVMGGLAPERGFYDQTGNAALECVITNFGAFGQVNLTAELGWGDTQASVVALTDDLPSGAVLHFVDRNHGNLGGTLYKFGEGATFTLSQAASIGDTTLDGTVSFDTSTASIEAHSSLSISNGGAGNPTTATMRIPSTGLANAPVDGHAAAGYNGGGLLIENTRPRDVNSVWDNVNLVVKGAGQVTQQFYDTEKAGYMCNFYLQESVFNFDWFMNNGDSSNAQTLLRFHADNTVALPMVGTTVPTAGTKKLYVDSNGFVKCAV